MKQNILELADRKIEQLQHYNDITSRIIYEDIDGVGELIENRQEIITTLNGISVDMQQYISEQSIDRQEEIKKIISPKENVTADTKELNDLSDELIELQGKIRIMTELSDEIKKNDIKAKDRIRKLRDEAYAELKNSVKTKQTIGYVQPNSGSGLSNGMKFNKSN